MRRCEDEKMFARPPLLEEPCAQTLSGTNANLADLLALPCRIGEFSCVSPRNEEENALDFYW